MILNIIQIISRSYKKEIEECSIGELKKEFKKLELQHYTVLSFDLSLGITLITYQIETHIYLYNSSMPGQRTSIFKRKFHHLHHIPRV